MEIQPSTRPETYSELLARSLKLYLRVLPSTFLFALFIAIILFIPRLLSVAVGQNVFLSTAWMNQLALLYLAMYLSIFWFMAALLWAINCIESNKHQNFIVDFKMAAKRVLYIFGAALCLSFIILLIGLLAFWLNELLWYFKLYFYNQYLSSMLLFLVLLVQLVFTVWVVTRLYFYFPLIVLEHEGIFLAFKQSAHLVHKQVKRTLALQLTPWMSYFISLLIIKMIFKLNINIYFMPKNPVSTLYPTLLHIIILALFIPWASSMILVQLRDLKLRKEPCL